MLKFFKTPLGIVTIIAIVALIALVIYNWSTITGWFSPSAGRQRMCKSDAQGDCYIERGGQREYVDCSGCSSMTT